MEHVKLWLIYINHLVMHQVCLIRILECYHTEKGGQRTIMNTNWITRLHQIQSGIMVLHVKKLIKLRPFGGCGKLL